MKLLVAITLFLFVMGCFSRQSDQVKIRYLDVESPATAQKVDACGQFAGRSYRVRMAHYRDGKIQYKFLENEPAVFQDTTQLFTFETSILSKNKVCFLIGLGEKNLKEETDMEDVLHSILLETYSNKVCTSFDTIPLIAYTNGFIHEMQVDGEIVQGGSYCEVRDAEIHPLEWSKRFNMKDYVWFELLIGP